MSKIIRILGCLLLISTIFATNVRPTMADGDPVSINLRVTGSGLTDIINVTGYSVPSGNITDNDVTVDIQTVMGALIYYCQDNSINIEVTDYGWGAYVVQIGDNVDDYNNWMYAYNERLIWVSAAEQTVEDNDSVHWFNSMLGCYQLLLAIDNTKIVQGEDITATVTWTDGGGTTSPAENAGVYVSDTMGTYQPEPGELIGYTNTGGQLTFAWEEVGQFWPYAEIDDRSSISQYPAPTFECIAPSYSFSLYPGWNFVSTPKKLEDDFCTVERVFGHIDTGAHSIWLYDAFASSPWGTGMTAGDEVKPLDGIWIYSTEEDTVYLVFDTNPRRVPPTKQLSAGWNAIGFSATDNASANSALTSVEAQWAYLIGFSSSTQGYETSIINNTTEGDHAESGEMYPGRGYWLYMTSDGELAAIEM